MGLTRLRRRVAISVLSAVVLGVSLLAAPQAAIAGACDAGWYYTIEKRNADTFKGVGPVLTSYNGTNSTSSVSFTSEVSGTVSLTTTGTVGVEVGVALAKINASYSVSSSASMTVRTGITTTIDVPKKKYGNGQYGAFKINVDGKSRYYTPACAVTQTKTSSISAPRRVGWKTWID